MKVLTDCKAHEESRHLQNKKTIHPHKEDDKSQNPTPKCTWRVKYSRIEEVQIAKKKILKIIIIQSLDLRGKTHPHQRKSSKFRRERKERRPHKLTSSAFMELIFSLNHQNTTTKVIENKVRVLEFESPNM